MRSSDGDNAFAGISRTHVSHRHSIRAPATVGKSMRVYSWCGRMTAPLKYFEKRLAVVRRTQTARMRVASECGECSMRCAPSSVVSPIRPGTVKHRHFTAAAVCLLRPDVNLPVPRLLYRLPPSVARIDSDDIQRAQWKFAPPRYNVNADGRYSAVCCSDDTRNHSKSASQRNRWRANQC